MKYNRIYAYTTQEVRNIEWSGSRKGQGLIKVGQTSDLTSEERIKRQLQGSPLILINNLYEILLDEEAIRKDGSYFKDTDVHKVLKGMGVRRIPKTEWFECTLEDIRGALSVLRFGGTARNKVSTLKDTAESRGVKYNSNEAYVERTKLTQENNILKVVASYKEDTSNVPIAKRLIELLNIKQYSVTSVSVLIGPIIKKVAKRGIS